MDTSHTTCRPLTTCLYLPPGRVTSNLIQGFLSVHDSVDTSGPASIPLTCVSFPPPYVSSPAHPAHLISTQSCLISQVGLLPVHAAHLTTSQLGLTPVSVDGVYGQMWGGVQWRKVTTPSLVPWEHCCTDHQPSQDGDLTALIFVLLH